MKMWPIAAAMVVDTLGSGLLGPFELLYGHVVVGLPLSLAGAALTAGTLLSIGVGPLAGALVDRIGAARVTMAANGISAGGCGLLLLAHSPFELGAAIFVLSAGTRSFWAAFSPLLAGIVPSGDRRAWFGRVRSLRYAGITGGQALAGVVLLLGERAGLRALVIGDGASYIVALTLVLLAAVPPVHQLATAAPARYRDALHDRANVGLAALNVLATLVITTPLIAMPVLVIDTLRFPAWLPGILAALNTLAIAVPAFFIGRLLGRRSSLGVLARAALLWVVGSLAFVAAATARDAAPALLPLGMTILGFGEAVYAPTADSLPLELAPPGLAGRYTAVHQLAWGISGAIAPTLAAVLLVAGRATLWAALAAGALVLAAAYAAADKSDSLEPRLKRSMQ